MGNDASNGFTGWEDFYRKAMSQAEDSVKDYGVFAEGLAKRWAALSGNFGGIMAESVGAVQGAPAAEAMRELHNLWENYQNKLGARVMRISEKEAHRFKEMAALWAENAKKAGVTASPESPGFGGKDVHMGWINASAAMSSQIEKALGDAAEEYEGIKKTMLELFDKADAILSSIDISDSKTEKAVKNVRESLGTMRGQIFDHVSSWTDSTMRLQKNWLAVMNSATEMFAKAFNNVDYGKMYSQFYKGFGWGGPAAPDDKKKVQSLEDEVRDLKAKLKDLEKDAVKSS